MTSISVYGAKIVYLCHVYQLFETVRQKAMYCRGAKFGGIAATFQERFLPLLALNLRSPPSAGLSAIGPTKCRDRKMQCYASQTAK
jgi:hypothetical protein